MPGGDDRGKLIAPMNLSPDFTIALILGIVEGLTEFIPVSSTGHLVLTGELMGFHGDKAATFEIFIQLGAILAVVVLYFQRFARLAAFASADSFSGVDGIKKLAVACLPAVVLGLIAHGAIKDYLFAPIPIAVALITGGAIMYLVERANISERVQSLEELTVRDAFLVGCAQCFALWPGISRSGSMIVGGLCLGFKRTVAAEFSFLVAVPIMVMATALDLYKSRTLLTMDDVPMFATGFIVSFLTSVIAIRFFMSLLRRVTLIPFAIYRIVFGLIVLYVIGLPML